MIWVLLHGDRAVFRGSYASVIETAAEWMVCERGWHPDGTELPPRLDRAYKILPEAMVARARRRAA